MRIFDITIYTTKLEAIKLFYSQLGFEVVHENPNGLVVYGLGGAELAFHKSEKDTSGLSISVISEDLDSLIEALKEDGIAVGEERPIHANFTGVEISDPQGNVVYILRDR
jgi:catechol 2,3-dioxygenase-like lactoylglutathione lyase family enzyme